jgi:hypothetical protein
MADSAHTTVASKIDRRTVMVKAWREYRFQTKWSDDKTFDRALFGQLLRDQWHYARMDRAEAIERAAEAVRLANASRIEQRIAAIKSEIKDMEYGDRIDWNRRLALGAELARIAA